MLEVGRVNFKHVGAHLMLEVRRARLLQAWLIYQSERFVRLFVFAAIARPLDAFTKEDIL